MQTVIGPWPLRPRRQWFAAADGTFYRNCPLIMDERKLAARWGRRLLAHRLGEEWNLVFQQGLTRKEKLGRGDVVVPQAAFRDAYPDRPGLWILDDEAVGAYQSAGQTRDDVLRYVREHVNSPRARAALLSQQPRLTPAELRTAWENKPEQEKGS